MATSRSSRSRSSPPPPAYEDDAIQNSLHNDQDHFYKAPYTTRLAVGARDQPTGYHQTIPKFAEFSEMTSTSGRGEKKSNTNPHAERANEFNKHHTCTSSTARQQQHQQHMNHQISPSLSRGHQQDPIGCDSFVRSLEAPKSFLGHISIEPFAFFAILALYIEFPAIQDLIYTKICLEVVGRHPNLTLAQYHQYAANNPAFTNGSTFVNGPTENRTNFSTANELLPSNGRIQQQTSSTSNGSQQPLIIRDPASLNNAHSSDQSQQHLLCDRLNKTAVPKAIRQEILDIDSLFWLKYQIVICLLCALAGPYWGGLSDKIGRVLPLNAPIVASVLCNAISLIFGLLISMNSHSLLHINWLYSGGLLVGLSGGQAVLIMNAFSFISDNTTSEDRSKRVTVLESVIFVAHSFGFFLSKMIMLLGLAPPDRPWLNRHFVAFGSCILLNLICLLYSVAKLRHHKFHRFLNNYEREQQEATITGSDGSLSRTSDRKRTGTANGQSLTTGERLRELTSSTPDDPEGPIARSDKANWTFWDSMVTFRYYRETFEMATKPRETRSAILLLLLASFVSALSLATLMSLFFVYVKMDPFNWTTSQYSSWNSISSVTRGVALIGLTLMMKFAPFWNVPDSIVAGIGFLGKGAGLLMIGLARSSSTINWSLIPFTFSEYSMPPIRSLLSKLVIREELGKVYSCMGSLQSLCFVLGNIAFYVAFTSYTQQDFFRITFLVVGAIELGVVIVMLMLYTSRRGAAQ